LACPHEEVCASIHVLDWATCEIRGEEIHVLDVARFGGGSDNYGVTTERAKGGSAVYTMMEARHQVLPVFEVCENGQCKGYAMHGATSPAGKAA
jgi:hypothetical protein